MKWLLLLALLLPATALGWDWSADTGYLRYSFNGKEQLGATSPHDGLRLSSGQGPSVFVSAGGHTEWFNFGVRAEAAYLFLSGQPEQEHVVKGKLVDTTNLASPLLIADLTAGFHVSRYKVELGAGIASVGVGQRWETPFDFDTAAHGAASVTFAHKGMDVTLAGEVLLLPAVTAKNDLVPAVGWTVTFGKAADVPLFTVPPEPTPLPVAPTAAVPLPQVEPPKPLPVELTPAALPVPITPAVAADPTPTASTALPAPATVAVAVEPPPAPTPTVSKPVEVKPKPVAQPISEDDPIILFIVSTLGGNAALEVEIKAYAEDKAIAQARAEQAREVIVKRGVDASRVWAVGKTRKGKAKSGKRDLEFTFAPRGTHK